MYVTSFQVRWQLVRRLIDAVKVPGDEKQRRKEETIRMGGQEHGRRMDVSALIDRIHPRYRIFVCSSGEQLAHVERPGGHTKLFVVESNWKGSAEQNVD